MRLMNDALRLPDLRFAAALVLPAAGIANVVAGPLHAALAALLTWAVIAALEAAWPPVRQSPMAVAFTAFHATVLRLYVPMHLALIGVGLWAAQRTDWGGVLLLAFAVGFVTGGQGITFAHELGHSRSRTDRALAWVLMASVGYAQFMVAHYRGHHVRAASWDDPASARPGESLWRFLPRTVGGGWSDSWRLESQRLERHALGWAASPLAWCTLLNLVAVLALAALGAHRMLAFWLLQSAFAVWLLETVNYVEHYGLQRARGADGRLEPFGVQHAWNADHALSNSVLANLQRHSDHHMHPWKRYPELQALPGPQLPTGYAGCLLLAAVPPWWFALMAPRLAAIARPATP